MSIRRIAAAARSSAGSRSTSRWRPSKSSNAPTEKNAFAARSSSWLAVRVGDVQHRRLRPVGIVVAAVPGEDLELGAHARRREHVHLGAGEW